MFIIVPAHEDYTCPDGAIRLGEVKSHLGYCVLIQQLLFLLSLFDRLAAA